MGVGPVEKQRIGKGLIIYKSEYPIGQMDKKAGGGGNMLQSWFGCGGGLQFFSYPVFFPRWYMTTSSVLSQQ